METDGAADLSRHKCVFDVLEGTVLQRVCLEREGCAGFCCVSDGPSEDRDEDQGSREKSVVSLSHQALQIQSQPLGRGELE